METVSRAPHANSPTATPISLYESWLTLTPKGVLHAFSSPEPDEQQIALQAMLREERAIRKVDWAIAHSKKLDLSYALSQQWVQMLTSPVTGPDTRLADFIRHVIAPLSGQRQALLASDSGFCLDRVGIDQEHAEILSAVAADFSEFARRQSRRGWQGANRYVSFFDDTQLLLPNWSFIPLWVDGSGYWIVVAAEPLLNNLALVELAWGICLAGNRFLPSI